MQNHFSRIMAKRTDAELINIVSIERAGYEPLALEAAEEEMRNRHLDVAFIEEIKMRLGEEKEQKEKRIGSDIRFINMFVDTVIFSVVGFGLTIPLLYIVPNQGTEAETFQILFAGMYLLAFFLYYVIMEAVFQRTLGKFITSTKVVMLDGQKPDLGAIVLRTCCRLIPFDNVSFLVGSGGFHDSLSKTTLIKK